MSFEIWGTTDFGTNIGGFSYIYLFSILYHLKADIGIFLTMQSLDILNLLDEGLIGNGLHGRSEDGCLTLLEIRNWRRMRWSICIPIP